MALLPILQRLGKHSRKAPRSGGKGCYTAGYAFVQVRFGMPLPNSHQWRPSWACLQPNSAAHHNKPNGAPSLDQPEYDEAVIRSPRHSSSVLSSPRKPFSITRIFSSDGNSRLLDCQTSFITTCAGFRKKWKVASSSFIRGHDEPVVLHS